MRVAYIVHAVVVDHDALVEGVEFEPSVLPSLLLPAQVGREEAAEFEDGSGVLGLRDGGCGRGRGVSDGGHGPWARAELEVRMLLTLWRADEREVHHSFSLGLAGVVVTSYFMLDEHSGNVVVS